MDKRKRVRFGCTLAPDVADILEKYGRSKEVSCFACKGDGKKIGGDAHHTKVVKCSMCGGSGIRPDNRPTRTEILEVGARMWAEAKNGQPSPAAETAGNELTELRGAFVPVTQASGSTLPSDARTAGKETMGERWHRDDDRFIPLDVGSIICAYCSRPEHEHRWEPFDPSLVQQLDDAITQNRAEETAKERAETAGNGDGHVFLETGDPLGAGICVVCERGESAHVAHNEESIARARAQRKTEHRQNAEASRCVLEATGRAVSEPAKPFTGSFPKPPKGKK